MKVFFEKKIAEEKKKMAEKGLKRIKFSKTDTAAYLKAANDAFWADLEKKIPKEVPTLKKLLGYK
jgi:tRNA A37 methylthiotransferase MiaB